MKKIQSKKLFEYLLSQGVLSSTDEEIQQAKKTYRKLYKKQWKQNRKLPQKEIRPGFTLRDYEDIKIRAHEMELTPTEYVRQIVVLSLQNNYILPKRGVLEKVAQLIYIAQNSYADFSHCLPEAERLLLEYLDEYKKA